MADRRVLPYGSWPSPISVEMSVAGALSLREPRLDGEDVYWIEGRPQERGRQVVVRFGADGQIVDVTPPGFDVRTMAHEYGGGAYSVAGGTVYFANLADARLYRQRPGSVPEPVTAEGPYRYADLAVDAPRNRVLAVREDHTPALGRAAAVEQMGDRQARGPEPENTLVGIDLDSGEQTVLARGHDFYSTPRLSPDARRLAWLCWRHPNMPWDGTELWLADLDESGVPRAAQCVAGGATESIVQPEWSVDGTLLFVSERSGWWNLYRHDAGGEDRPLAPMEAEFAGPQWVFGLRWYGVAADRSIVAIARRDGRDGLWRIPPDGSPPRRFDVPDQQIQNVHVEGSRAVYVGSSATESRAILLFDVDTGERRVLRRASSFDLDAAYVSSPETISFPTADGREAHALYYRPTNPAAEAPAGERPPLVVMSHGGPTSYAWGGLDLETQMFTSRGFAVVDVDYGGSTGYGREYRQRLDGQWGIVDVQDCIHAARFLAARGDVDAERMAIRGGSAGGFTTLAALVFHDVFAAGATHYGVGDLEALARDTHKFESRYLDRLVAPYPEGVDVYRERSPVHHMERINRPVIVLQGEDDRVVPVAQAEALVRACRDKRIPHSYLLFAGEGHGFRRAETMIRAREAELSFYAQVFGFELADAIEPVPVAFLAGVRTRA